jgi:hypothetical protein
MLSLPIEGVFKAYLDSLSDVFRDEKRTRRRRTYRPGYAAIS